MQGSLITSYQEETNPATSLRTFILERPTTSALVARTELASQSGQPGNNLPCPSAGGPRHLC